MSEHLRAAAERFVAEYAEKSPGAFVQAPRMVTVALRDFLRVSGHPAVDTFGCFRGLPEGYLPDDEPEWTDPERRSFASDPWEIHYWVVCDGVIIDACSGRFGFEGYPIIVVPVGDPRYADA